MKSPYTPFAGYQIPIPAIWQDFLPVPAQITEISVLDAGLRVL
jgi:hypothetical protein